MDKFPIDSGINISPLSLNCSPRDCRMSFIEGGGSYRPSSSIPRLNQTSLINMVSASPVHVNPLFQKKSASESGSGYFSSDKICSQSGGLLKELHPRYSSDFPHYHTAHSGVVNLTQDTIKINDHTHKQDL